jgi:xanthine dehydrogenase accessory factor
VGAALIVSQTLDAIAQGERCAWITVARTAGSAPREVGARMLITMNATFDTIGGGQLEYRAIEIARASLQNVSPPRLERFPLSARVGQCCGGTVWLAIEKLSETDFPWLRAAQQQLTRNGAYARSRSLVASDGPFAWRDTIAETAPQVFLFGAGHVGRALAAVLSVNDVQLTWVDSRDAQFPAAIPPHVVCVETDSPCAEIRKAPAQASYLIMTHSHALDFELIEEILRRDDAAFIGLIGSATKRAQFEIKLRDRGISEMQLQQIVCPIGVAGIESKHPGAIATAVAAQLLQQFSPATALQRARA